MNPLGPTLAVLVAGFAAPHGGGEPAVVERRLMLMGTEAEVRIEALERAAALAASEAAVEALERAEARLSTWTEESELARLNRAPVGEAVALSPELAGELAAADACRRATAGAFDAGVGPLVDAWGLREGGRQPHPGELAAARVAAGADGLELREGPVAVRRRPGARFEEGGFGKGAALDAAVAHLAAEPAVESARLDLGGQVALYRRPGSEGVATELGVAHPRDRRHPVVALTVPSGSVATSGNSERGITVAGERRSHVLDPRTGEPAPDFGSLTVWTAPRPGEAASALLADCLSTGLYVLGPEAALAWAAAHPGVEVLVLRIEGDRVEALATPGLEGSLRVLDPGIVTRRSSQRPAQEAGDPKKRSGGSSRWLADGTTLRPRQAVGSALVRGDHTVHEEYICPVQE